ncbi:MAG: hypothetical protein R8K50_04145 [Mariprofundus sp.]
MNAKKDNKYRGSNFDSFLEEEGILEECTAEAIKRVLSMELADAMAASGVSKSELSHRLHTSRTQIDRILNPKETGTSLENLFLAAHKLGKRLEIRLT